MIVDTHTHLGVSALSAFAVTEGQLIETMDRHGVDLSLVLPHPVMDNPFQAHDDIAAAVARHPGRLRGVASLSPIMPPDHYRREMERCIHDLGFVAIKFHPPCHLLPPTSEKADIVFRTAHDLHVPVIVHTGIGVPNGLPSLCILPARAYPDLPIILAHAGYGVYVQEALVAATVCPNIFVEPSWCGPNNVKMLVQELGAERMLMGSDQPDNLPVELAKYHAAGLTEAQLERIFSGTARMVFNLGKTVA
jgi:uncharacterized protein